MTGRDDQYKKLLYSLTLFALITFALTGILASEPVLSSNGATSEEGASRYEDYIIIAWNDLGMHCMNRYYNHICILPPFNTVWAQVIRRGSETGSPGHVFENVEITYSIQNNTYSVGKTDFWNYEDQLFGVNLAPNIGLTGSGLTGSLESATYGWVVEGIPLTPYDDGDWITQQAYQLMDLDLALSSVEVDATTIVAPVSVEMHCDDCHTGAQGPEVAILSLHDDEEATNLVGNQPVLCADCHASNALGMPGNPDLPNLSLALHGKHSEAVGKEDPTCYQCHPGALTQCLRGQHYINGMTCEDCHGDLLEISQSIEAGREPWLEEPSCGDCHGSNYAPNPNTLYRNSRGHGGMYCEACHGSPHAIFPSVMERDNRQSIRLQGHSGKLSDCTVCHRIIPDDPGPHSFHPLATPTPVATTTPTTTITPATSATRTPTLTASPTRTPTRTGTRTPTRTATLIPTSSPTPSNTPVQSATPTIACVHHGDVNFDGTISAGDAQLAFYIALGAYQPSFVERCAADCNGDNVISAGDAQLIFLTALGYGQCVDPL